MSVELLHVLVASATDVIEQLLPLAQRLQPARMALPCEVQLFGLFKSLQDSSILLATALWSGSELAYVLPRERAHVLLGGKGRHAVHYPYLVLRRLTDARDGLEHLYVLPPVTVRVVPATTTSGALDVLRLEAELPLYAEVYATLRP